MLWAGIKQIYSFPWCVLSVLVSLHSTFLASAQEYTNLKKKKINLLNGKPLYEIGDLVLWHRLHPGWELPTLVKHYKEKKAT